jgi:DNA polymerase III epsilon subunit family exonuclease
MEAQQPTFTSEAPVRPVAEPPKRFSLIQKLREIPLAFVDVETTGASAEWGDRVVELGIARFEGGRLVARYQQLIDPQRKMSLGASVITGITDAMLAGQPRFSEQFPAAVELLRGAAVLGHNVRFDLSFLRKEFRRCGCDLPEALGDVPVLDTVRIARRRFGRGGNGLQNLARRLGCPATTAHRALADALTTAAVFERLMAPAGGWDLCLCDAIREQGGSMGLLPISTRETLLPLELEEALEQRCAVMMEYLDARAKRTQRMIEPLQVRRFNGELTLVAHCHLRNDRRTFKVDRIIQLTRVEANPPATNEPTADDAKASSLTRGDGAIATVTNEPAATADSTEATGNATADRFTTNEPTEASRAF